MIAQTRKQTTVSIWIKQHRVSPISFSRSPFRGHRTAADPSAQGWITTRPFAIHYPASFGRCSAAHCRRGHRWGRRRKAVGPHHQVARRPTGTIFAFLSPVVLFVLAAVVVWREWRRMAVQRRPRSTICLIWDQRLFCGWRPSALAEDRLRGYAPRHKDRSALSATDSGVMWVVWHIPAFFYLDTYVNLGWPPFPVRAGRAGGGSC
jgi:hypothetical protein